MKSLVNWFYGLLLTVAMVSPTLAETIAEGVERAELTLIPDIVLLQGLFIAVAIGIIAYLIIKGLLYGEMRKIQSGYRK